MQISSELQFTGKDNVRDNAPCFFKKILQEAMYLTKFNLKRMSLT